MIIPTVGAPAIIRCQSGPGAKYAGTAILTCPARGRAPSTDTFRSVVPSGVAASSVPVPPVEEASDRAPELEHAAASATAPRRILTRRPIQEPCKHRPRGRHPRLSAAREKPEALLEERGA